MRRIIISAFLAATCLSAAVVLDRIAVVVGQRVVKLSDVERELRLTEFLNRETLDLSAAAKRKAAERLIDQQLIRDELSAGGYQRATDADAAAMLEQIRKNRYANSDAQLRAALMRYGLTEDQLKAQLLWQMTVLRFIEERFRPGVLITDADIRSYYDAHAALHKATLDAASPKIRENLEGERINQEFDTWLREQRQDKHIEYREGAFQ